jgi:hypothetical protein
MMIFHFFLLFVVVVVIAAIYTVVVVGASPSTALLADIFNECGSSHRLRKNVNATLETNSLKMKTATKPDDDYGRLSAGSDDSPLRLSMLCYLNNFQLSRSLTWARTFFHIRLR